ncbi:MAG: cell division protein FtsZ [Candidatus Anstonellales archaeon]
MTGNNADVRIAVIGVGGAGSNAVNRLKKNRIESARTIAVNTDARHLKFIHSDEKILIGKSITKGLGAGGMPEVAKKCAEADRKLLSERIGEMDIVFISAGMGGGTGTGAAPIIADIAKEQGAITVAMVTYPFAIERSRIKTARMGIQKLINVCDTVVVIDNNRMVQYVPNLPLDKAFELADSIVGRAVKAIADSIVLPSMLNMDFADFKAVMAKKGLSMISLGEGKGANKIEEAVKNTLEHPLLEVDYEDANGALVHVEGSPKLTLAEAIRAGELMTVSFSPDSEVKLGARVNPSMSEDAVVLTAIITGVKSPHIIGMSEPKLATTEQKAEMFALA